MNILVTAIPLQNGISVRYPDEISDVWDSRRTAHGPRQKIWPEGKVVQWSWLTSECVKRHYKHIHVKNESHLRSQDPKKSQNTQNFLKLPAGPASVNDLGWPSNGQEKRYKVRGSHILTLVIHYTFILVNVKILKARFRRKSVD